MSESLRERSQIILDKLYDFEADDGQWLIPWILSQLAAVRVDALEEAAKVAEDCNASHDCEGPLIAKQIRALMETRK